MPSPIPCFSCRDYEKPFLAAASTQQTYDLVYHVSPLTMDTLPLVSNSRLISCFVNDDLNANILQQLKHQGVEFISLRSAGFNNVDLAAAKALNIQVARVPEYSPYAVAEYTVGMILDLNRKIHRAHQRVREGNFSLNGLLGFDLHGKTVAIIGTGKIGRVFAKIMLAFGCKVLAYDIIENPEAKKLGVTYVKELKTLLADADIVSLHCPLTPDTQHLINTETLSFMKPGAMLINTGRGALIDTQAAIKVLKTRQLGALGLDVYEEEAGLFFEDLSDQIIEDDVIARLLTFPNVLITSHQAFLTKEALTNIANTTMQNLSAFIDGDLAQAHLVT